MHSLSSGEVNVPIPQLFFFLQISSTLPLKASEVPEQAEGHTKSEPDCFSRGDPSNSVAAKAEKVALQNFLAQNGRPFFASCHHHSDVESHCADTAHSVTTSLQLLSVSRQGPFSYFTALSTRISFSVGCHNSGSHREE